VRNRPAEAAWCRHRRLGGESPNLLHVLGLDPFAGLDPATREIAETRQFGERLLFTLQRLSFLIRLNGEMLANNAARDLGVERLIASLDRASAGIGPMA